MPSIVSFTLCFLCLVDRDYKFQRGQTSFDNSGSECNWHSVFVP